MSVVTDGENVGRPMRDPEGEAVEVAMAADGDALEELLLATLAARRDAPLPARERGITGGRVNGS